MVFAPTPRPRARGPRACSPGGVYRHRRIWESVRRAHRGGVRLGHRAGEDGGERVHGADGLSLLPGRRVVIVPVVPIRRVLPLDAMQSTHQVLLLERLPRVSDPSRRPEHLVLLLRPPSSPFRHGQTAGRCWRGILLHRARGPPRLPSLLRRRVGCPRHPHPRRRYPRGRDAADARLRVASRRIGTARLLPRLVPPKTL